MFLVSINPAPKSETHEPANKQRVSKSYLKIARIIVAKQNNKPHTRLQLI